MKATPITNAEATKLAPKWLATGGILAVLGATTCCILPLVLTILGVSGAWMSNLRSLSPYQPYLLALSVLAIGYGFYQVYWKPRKLCAEGKVCARPLGGNIVRITLWSGTMLVLVTATFSLWFPFVLPYLP